MNELTPLEPNRTYALYNTHLAIEDNTTFEQWEEIGRAIYALHEMTPIWLGDWLNIGEAKWGEMYSQALDITGLEIDTLAHYKSVALRVPRVNRFPGLRFSHYRLVSKLEGSEQKKALELAYTDKLSIRDFKKSLNLKEVKEPACALCHSTENIVQSMRICRKCKLRIEL